MLNSSVMCVARICGAGLLLLTAAACGDSGSDPEKPVIPTVPVVTAKKAPRMESQEFPGIVRQPAGVTAGLDSALEVLVNIPLNVAQQIRRGHPIRVVLPDLNKSLDAEVVRIGATSRITGDVPVYSTLTETGTGIYPGMAADVVVTYEVPGAAPVIRVPITASFTDANDKLHVYVVNPVTGILEKRAVYAPTTQEDQLAVELWLQEGEIVVARGVHQLHDGQKVETVPADQAAAR